MDRIREFQHQGRTIILVSHALDQVVELCSRVILLDHGHVVHDGSPAVAVGKFRDLLEERRLAELAESTTDEQRRSGAVVRVVATVPGAGVENILAPGDDLEIRVTVTSTSLENWVCRIQIDDAMGQKVFVTGTDWLGTELPSLTGERSIVLSLDSPALGGGKYFVNATLLDEAGQTLHSVIQATSFNVAPDSEAIGYLRIPTVCRVDGL